MTPYPTQAAHEQLYTVSCTACAHTAILHVDARIVNSLSDALDLVVAGDHWCHDEDPQALTDVIGGNARPQIFH